VSGALIFAVSRPGRIAGRARGDGDRPEAARPGAAEASGHRALPGRGAAGAALKQEGEVGHERACIVIAGQVATT
jgi:hypothetical protein